MFLVKRNKIQEQTINKTIQRCRITSKHTAFQLEVRQSIKKSQLPRTLGPLPLILDNIISHDAVSLIKAFHSLNAGIVGAFQCVKIILASDVPTIKMEWELLVNFGISRLSPVRHERGDSGKEIPTHASKSFNTRRQNGLTVEHSHLRCMNVPISVLQFQHVLVLINPTCPHGVQ